MMLWNRYPSLFIHYRHLSWQKDSVCDFYLGPLTFLSLLSPRFSPVSLLLISLYLSVTHSASPVLSRSISLLFLFFLHPSLLPFLWNVMIHWLWSLWAVSLKSVCLLSATTEWYITSIPCNFLGFIRYIYSPYNGGGCSFLQSSEYLSLAPRPCSWKPLSGVGSCQDLATKFVYG